MVILHGEIYYSCLDQASYLADMFTEYGDHFAKEIHGSFAILLVDKVKDSVALITDRVNSRRIFYSQYQNNYCLSSHFSYQPCDAFPLDPTGIAWYLSNYSTRFNRTLFKGISIFKQACIHRLTKKEIKSIVYWICSINSPSNNITKKQYKTELFERLIASVKRRLYDHPTVFVSLSAGYDVSTILGILAHDLHLPEVNCFSYEHGIAQVGSDAYQAKLMAEKVGYPFEIIESYTGNFIDFIVNNAEQSIGNGLCWLCSELDAWQILKTKVTSIERPAVFFGDECFTLTKEHLLTTVFDVLISLRIYGFDQLSFLMSFLPNDTYEIFAEGIAEDIATMIPNISAMANLYDARHLLQIDEMHSNWLLPYRESYAGQYMNVRNPLLDNDVLDFVASLPDALQQDPSLRHDTVTNRYPKLFSIKRATSPGNCYFDLKRECEKHQVLLQELIKSKKSRLDELIPPHILLNLLDNVVKQPSSIPSSKKHLLEKLHNTFGKAHRKLFSSRPKIRPTNAANILTKILILRVALSR